MGDDLADEALLGFCDFGLMGARAKSFIASDSRRHGITDDTRRTNSNMDQTIATSMIDNDPAGARDGGDARLEQLVERVRHLPTLPDIYLKLQEEVRSADPDITRVASLMENDPAMTVKVLQLVNSPLMGLRYDVADVRQAAALIGLRRLTSLVLASGVFRPVSHLDERLIHQLWQDSLVVGGLSRLILVEEGHDARAVEEAQLAGLLHDIGEVVLFQNWRDDYMNIDHSRRDRDEIESFGATHAAISGYLCSSWNLSDTVVDAARLHHAPSSQQSVDTVSVTTAVHVARALVDAGMDADAAALDLEHLEELDVVARVPGWADLASEAGL